MTIWKYVTPMGKVADIIEFDMPSGARILSVGNQKESLCLWALRGRDGKGGYWPIISRVRNGPPATRVSRPVHRNRHLHARRLRPPRFRVRVKHTGVIDMSADNWAYCPKCKSRADQKKIQQRAEAAAAYGKVPAEEWKCLTKLADETADIETTLREYYGIGTGQDGTFRVTYRCRCTDCDFSHEFQHEEKLT